MKNVVVLGSTGSIGENALRVARALPDRLRIVGLAVQRNTDRVLEQAREFGVEHVAVSDPAAAQRCAAELPKGVTLHAGPEGLVELAMLADADIVLCSVVGLAGLPPVLAAVEQGTDVALATKEVLVGAGQRVMQICEQTGARLLPVDSEHSGLFQCLSGHTADGAGVRRMILTASGGPFRNQPGVDFDQVTASDALAHPTWSMGPKVTIDSATLMNKGLELIEAHWFFGVPFNRLDVIVHPQSIVHAMIEFADGNSVAHMTRPDMRFAIQYALTWPDRCEGGLPALDLESLDGLTFEAPDRKRFPCLDLAVAAGEAGGTTTAVLNAANEVAVERFLAGEILFSGIWRLVESALSDHKRIDDPDLDAIMAADQWARAYAREEITC
ncbi:MAG: 1-deoxy-D-xylulose-5-phosphate reductoisomerase [Kiritimatiellia bacterium]|jgi:1-deoxy-D-xylulose-5-phosphate reductoisomerase|nr:1-deoxy-D-xylulose-5-phosphate reductoisomerase [Kiritimatiellia bacterium]MDP6631430.1 1-deoxy-D-xylulose-5-phosphate reductoisomerase [Kiritimatiellia bacterium]MDP6809097.1 1-deoxy-D-xylulose-5-phosphate reductoisomerase [Kiritimatiellia bacterium]MDP7023211.1 1-deoxy-D-xylulose-5-phosphate reductoisomerase [Kiritimatiellia bacterium]